MLVLATAGTAEQRNPTHHKQRRTTMTHPPAVSREEWLVARQALLLKEKEATHARDWLNAERRRAGKDLIRIDERDTSKTCSGCGTMQPMPLWKRTYRCGTCGLVIDRDENSAVSIRERFAFPAEGHTRVIPCGVRS
jgi:putative transposase